MDNFIEDPRVIPNIFDYDDANAPNQLFLDELKRRHYDPWKGRVDDRGRQVNIPAPVDFAGREYVDKFLSSTRHSETNDNRVLRRDALIESILALDQTRNEYIRRLVIEDQRLDVLMKLLGYRCPPHQMIMSQFLHSKKTGLVLAPRGSGKSTACNVCYCILRALINRDVHILIASRTEDQAKSFLSEIKENLSKPELTEIFGNLRGSKWGETQADIAGRKIGAKEHTFTIAGADGTVVSKHFHIIIGDDLVEEKNSITEGKRKKLVRFFYKSLLPTLRPGGHLYILGTRYHPDDLYGYLIENDPLFQKNYFVLPVVFDKETGEPVTIEQDDDGKYFIPDNATVYDPEGFPEEEILIKRSSMPTAEWGCQYENTTHMMRGDFFDSDWFRYYDILPEELVKKYDLSIWIGVDLAATLSDKSDETALVVVGITRNMSEIYILDFLAARLTFNSQIETVRRFYDRWDPVRTYIESNAYQSVMANTTKELFPDMRVSPIYTTKDKVTRARVLQAYYERRQVYHRKGRSDKLEEQLVGFPEVKWKDLFDAEFFAINGAARGQMRKRRSPEDEPGLF